MRRRSSIFCSRPGIICCWQCFCSDAEPIPAPNANSLQHGKGEVMNPDESDGKILSFEQPRPKPTKIPTSKRVALYLAMENHVCETGDGGRASNRHIHGRPAQPPRPSTARPARGVHVCSRQMPVKLAGTLHRFVVEW